MTTPSFGSPQEELHRLLKIILASQPDERVYKRAIEQLFAHIPRWPGIKTQWTIGDFTKNCPLFSFEDVLQDAFIDLAKSLSKGTFQTHVKIDTKSIVDCDTDALYANFRTFFNLILKRRAIDQYTKLSPLDKDSPDKKYRVIPISLDTPIDSTKSDSGTLGETVYSPVLEPLEQLMQAGLFGMEPSASTLMTDVWVDASWLTAQSSGFSFTETAFEQLRVMSLKQCQACNCESLSRRVMNNERWTEIWEDFNGICSDAPPPYQTIVSHWKKKCIPLLRTIYREFDPERYS